MSSTIVIGAGVIGATIAWQLTAAGNSVRLIDSRRPGDGATRASAGVLAPYIEGHPASPLRELGRESLDRFDEFVARLRRESGRVIIYDRSGTLEVALDLAEAERLSAASAALWHAGVEARWLPAGVIGDVEPDIAPDAPGALLIPMHAYVGVSSLTRAAVAAAQLKGAQLLVDEGAVRIQPVPGGGVAVITARDTYEADSAVLATGSWSSQVIVEGADPAPVKPIRGQLLQLQARPGLLRRVIWGSAGYLVPWPDGSLLVGATVEDVGFDESSTDEARQVLLDMAVALVPELKQARVMDARAGLRPKGPDDLPLVGRSRAVPGLVYATGHYRNGVLLAPLTAEIVEQLVLDPGAVTRPELEPSRFGHL